MQADFILSDRLLCVLTGCVAPVPDMPPDEDEHDEIDDMQDDAQI